MVIGIFTFCIISAGSIEEPPPRDNLFVGPVIPQTLQDPLALRVDKFLEEKEEQDKLAVMQEQEKQEQAEKEIIEEQNPSINSTVEIAAPPVNNVYSISPYARDFKCYMDYRAITSITSTQYKMQQQAYTDENGLRKIGEYYCVAMGTYYGKCGDKFYVETDQGNSWKVIISDIKSDLHTDSTHRYSRSNGCMMEFIVDTDKLPTTIARSGTVNGLGFQGNIIYLEKLN